MALITEQQLVTITVSAIVFMVVDKIVKAFFRRAGGTMGRRTSAGRTFVPSGYAAS